MRLIHTNDPAMQKAALHTIQELIDAGYAGLDCYDHEIFVVDAPTELQLDDADVALDLLGASFRQVGPIGGTPGRLECNLPRSVRAELGLDRPGAPEIVVPLASRAVTRRVAVLDVLIDDITRSGATV